MEERRLVQGFDPSSELVREVVRLTNDGFARMTPPVQVGDIVPYNGEQREVVAVAEDGVTVTVGERRQFPPAGEQVLITPNRAMRRAKAAGARAGAKARARMLRRRR